MHDLRHHRVGVALPEADWVRQEVFLRNEEERLHYIVMTDELKVSWKDIEETEKSGSCLSVRTESRMLAPQTNENR